MRANEGVEMPVDGDVLIRRKPAHRAREGWAEAARQISEAGDDELAMGEFANDGDAELTW